MKTNPVYTLIAFDELSATIKYPQLANSILNAIGNGKLLAGDALPSINEFPIIFFKNEP